jgi:hypothetical protein
MFINLRSNHPLKSLWRKIILPMSEVDTAGKPVNRPATKGKRSQYLRIVDPTLDDGLDVNGQFWQIRLDLQAQVLNHLPKLSGHLRPRVSFSLKFSSVGIPNEVGTGKLVLHGYISLSMRELRNGIDGKKAGKQETSGKIRIC